MRWPLFYINRKYIFAYMKKVCSLLVFAAAFAGSVYAQIVTVPTPITLEWVPDSCISISDFNLNNGASFVFKDHDFYSAETRQIYSDLISSPKKTLEGFVERLCPIAGVALETTTDGKRIAVLDTSANSTIVIPPNFKADSLVFNRKFSEGVYSTIALPFKIETSRIHGAEFYEFDGITYDSTIGKYVAQWVGLSLDSIEANVPYVIKPTAETMTIDMDSSVEWDSTGAKVSKLGNWSFVSTMDKKSWETGSEEIGRVFGIAANAKDSVNSNGDSTHIKPGDFVKVVAGAWIRSLRGYLLYTSGTQKNAAPPAYAAPDKNVESIEDVDQIVSVFKSPKVEIITWNSTSCVDISGFSNGTTIQPDGGDFYDGVSIISTGKKKNKMNNSDSLCPIAGVTLKTENGKSVATLDASADTVVMPPNFKADSVVFKRTFTINTNSTISFPFSVPAGNVAGAEFFEFTGVAYDSTEKKWFANMQSVSSDSILANIPYIVVPTATEITIKGSVNFASTYGCANEACKASVGKWNFVALYERKDFAGDEIGKTYGFAANSKVTDGKNISAGQFVRVKEGAFIRPMRGYLVYVNNVQQARPAALGMSFAPSAETIENLPSTIEVRIISSGVTEVDSSDTAADSGDKEVREKNTTSIGVKKVHAGEMDVKVWYDIRGRKINKKPTTKGAYYMHF